MILFATISFAFLVNPAFLISEPPLVLATQASSSQALYIQMYEMGLWQCALELHTDEFPELLGKIKPTKFKLLIWIRYLMPRGPSGKPEVRALVFAEPLANSFKIMPEEGRLLPHSISINPQLQLHSLTKPSNTAHAFSPDSHTRAASIGCDQSCDTSVKDSKSSYSRGARASIRNISVDVKFQIVPITKDALPFASMASRTPLDPSWASANRHEYLLTALGGGGPGKECDFRPLDLLLPSDQLLPEGPLRHLIPRSIPRSTKPSTGSEGEFSSTSSPLQPNSSADNDPISVHQSFKQPWKHLQPEVAVRLPSQAIVIAKPMWPMNAENLAMIDRHIQHYKMLGFSKYVLYVRPGIDMDVLLTEPRTVKWVHRGVLVLVLWDMMGITIPDELPGWTDQRVIYNHAVLSFLGQQSFLAMVDVDEFLISFRPGLLSVFDMVKACTSMGNSNHQAVNLRLRRFNVLVEEWPNRNKSEISLWIPDDGTMDDPLSRYRLIDRLQAPEVQRRYPQNQIAVKSMVLPEHIALYHIHSASTLKPYRATEPDPSCMGLAHLRNLQFGREDALRVAQRYSTRDDWSSALERFGWLRRKWLAEGGNSKKK